jgi:phage terminase small subunit
MKWGLTTAKQVRFVEEYVIDFNATQAAIRAGYSHKTAGMIGAENLTKPIIQKAIQDSVEILSSKSNITAERVLAEYAKLAFSEMGDYADWNYAGVRLKDSIELTPDQLAAVQEVSESMNGVRIKLHDKKGALDSLAKYLRMFVERHEHTGKDGGPIENENVNINIYLPDNCRDDGNDESG